MTVKRSSESIRLSGEGTTGGSGIIIYFLCGYNYFCVIFSMMSIRSRRSMGVSYARGGVMSGRYGVNRWVGWREKLGVVGEGGVFFWIGSL